MGTQFGIVNLIDITVYQSTWPSKSGLKVSIYWSCCVDSHPKREISFSITVRNISVKAIIDVLV